jgi:hypothetical protein
VIDQKFVIVGALINLVGTSGYARDTILGKTRPNRISWLMWSLAPLIAFAAEISKGVGLVALTTFMAGFCPLIILVASFVNRKSVWKLSTFDFVCGFLSLLGLSLWLITRDGNIAIIFAVLADAFAALPTISKSYSEPGSESWFAFFAAAISAGIALLTIKVWTFANYAFPLYLFLICILLVLLVRFNLGLKIKEARIQST